MDEILLEENEPAEHIKFEKPNENAKNQLRVSLFDIDKDSKKE